MNLGHTHAISALSSKAFTSLEGHCFVFESCSPSHHSYFLVLISERKNPPVFTKKPSEHIEDMEGKLVKIEGRVSGSQPISVSWFKDDMEIQSSDKYDISFKSNVAVLCIKNSQVIDSGRYSCQASNEAGKASCDVTVGISGMFDLKSKHN